MPAAASPAMSSLLLFLLLLAHSSASDDVAINLESPHCLVDDDFLSLTIDAGSIAGGWSDINFTSTKILNMAKALSPVTLRVGGTMGDYLVFDPNKLEPDGGDSKDFTMSPLQWDAVNLFTQAIGWKFIFGINQLLSNPDKTWNSTNAEMIIDYTLKKNYSVSWELGNEPDHYSDGLSEMKRNSYKSLMISGQQIAENFQKLHSILKEKNYPNAFIAGPDVASAGEVFENFLEADVKSTTKVIDAATWHNYYRSSTEIQLTDFYSVKVLDRLYDTVGGVMDIINKTGYTGDLWLGETSSSYGGGRVLYSECFISGFMWLDKLGITAYTQNKVFRQDFVGGHYALLDGNQNPLPDYWLSLLYKRLVGTRVLEVQGALDKGRSVRTYAHCAKPPYSKGSVVLIALNTKNDSTNVSLTNSQLQTSSRDVYWLTPAAPNITSQNVLLNGVQVELLNGESIPQLSPKTTSSDTKIELPPLSFGFIVFTNANAKACSL